MFSFAPSGSVSITPLHKDNRIKKEVDFADSPFNPFMTIKGDFLEPMSTTKKNLYLWNSPYWRNVSSSL